MKLEVLLSIMNVEKENLDKMNITSSCTVINQCEKNSFEEYKNFKIYSYNEKGLSNSRNRGLEHIKEDIVLLCDDDMIYNKDYEINVIKAFEENSKADIIIFNINSPNRKTRLNQRNKRLHIFNSLRYTSCRIAFRKDSVLKKNIRFNNLFGAGAKYSNGEDTLFLVECLRKKIKIYSNIQNISTVAQTSSTWFKKKKKKFFFDKGALFTAISKTFRRVLFIQYLLRHKELLTNYKFIEAYKIMLKGSKDYITGNM